MQRTHWSDDTPEVARDSVVIDVLEGARPDVSISFGRGIAYATSAAGRSVAKASPNGVIQQTLVFQVAKA